MTADQGTLEVAHEALLREWPRLRGWLEEDAEGRRLHQHLIHAASEWQAGGRDSGELYRGARLASTLDWAAGHEGELNELERSFLDEGRAEAELEAEHQRRANRRLRVVLAGLAALLALAVVTGIVALNQRGEARDAARAADAQRLGTEALGQERVDEALLLTRAAVELDESPATLGSLLSVLLRNPAAIGVLNYGWPMYGAAFSPDGRLMATGDERGAVNVYDAATRRPVGAPYVIEGGLVQNVRFTPDGASIVVSSMDPQNRDHNGVVDVIDARTLKRTLRSPGAAAARPAELGVPGRGIPAERSGSPRPPGARLRAGRPGRAGVSGGREDRRRHGSTPRGAARFRLLRVVDGGPRAVLPHQPAGRPDVGARPGAASRGALLAGRRHGRGGEPRRTGVRARLRGWSSEVARPGLRPDPFVRWRLRRTRVPDEVHT